MTVDSRAPTCMHLFYAIRSKRIEHRIRLMYTYFAFNRQLFCISYWPNRMLLIFRRLWTIRIHKTRPATVILKQEHVTVDWETIVQESDTSHFLIHVIRLCACKYVNRSVCCLDSGCGIDGTIQTFFSVALNGAKYSHPLSCWRVTCIISG